jgi:hypothetical protein
MGKASRRARNELKQCLLVAKTQISGWHAYYRSDWPICKGQEISTLKKYS